MEEQRPALFHCEFATEVASLTITTEELARMECLGLLVWATPSPDGVAQQAYIASRPKWRDDFVLAGPGDFLGALGIDSLGWEEMNDEEQEECAGELITITVPRVRQHRKA